MYWTKTFPNLTYEEKVIELLKMCVLFQGITLFVVCFR